MIDFTTKRVLLLHCDLLLLLVEPLLLLFLILRLPMGLHQLLLLENFSLGRLHRIFLL